MTFWTDQSYVNGPNTIKATERERKKERKKKRRKKRKKERKRKEKEGRNKSPLKRFSGLKREKRLTRQS